MKRPEVSLAIQGWLLIVGVAVIMALTIAPGVERLINTKSETAFLINRTETLEARLEALPVVTARVGETRNEMALSAQVQQTLSNTIRSNGARLTELAAQGRVEAPIPALIWRAGMEGDVLAVQETLTALGATENMLVEMITIKPVRNGGQTLSAQFEISTPLQIVPLIASDNLGLGTIISRNPFNPDRSRFDRGRIIAPVQVQAVYEPVLLGLRKKNGAWVASVQLEERGLPETLSIGDETRVGTVLDISKSGLKLRSNSGEEKTLSNPFD